MRVRCMCCRQEDDVSNMKPGYYYAHEGRCDIWLREREANAPAFMPSLWPLPTEKLMRYGAVALCVLAIAQVMLG